jgi:hypothetical protein
MMPVSKISPMARETCIMSGARRAPETRALEHLRVIRDTMERSHAFQAVPGMSGVLVGMTALAAAWLASTQSDGDLWLAVWSAEAALGFAIGIGSVLRKARATAIPVRAQPARRFAIAYLTPVAAGGVLSVVLWRAGRYDLLPGTWLLLYGTGAIGAGMFSHRLISRMGAVFFALGALTFALPPAAGDVLMAVGFGGVHGLFGLLLSRAHRHGR